MLTPFAELLAGRDDGAVGAFTCYDLEAAVAVLDAAATRGSGVILLIGGKVFAGERGPLLLAAMVAVAERSDARACVQLDHCQDLGAIAAALEQGAGAVMADGSELPFEQNIAFVHRAVELARACGAGVECELGGIRGDEDVARAVAAGALTDPGQADALMERSGADCLAVSIGNVHGTYRDPPRLDWERLAAIRACVEQPLSLHGASGLPEPMIERALEAGIAKVNINTELRRAYLVATSAALPHVLDGADITALHDAQIRALREVAVDKLGALEGALR
ncbi:MAG TPA: class II fructose-bisphosphate aldolase [Gaiellales bacterium]|jgi:ketose-bisphosphate aldolase